MINTFQNQFNAALTTNDIKFNQGSLDAAIASRVDLYKTGMGCQERINAQILPELITKVSELLNEGWAFTDWKAPHSGMVGSCYIYLKKSPALQAEDIQFIEDKLTEVYEQKVFENYEAEKNRLVQAALQEARRKDAEEQAKKEQDRMDKLEKQAIAALEKQLQEAK
ncbi:hypothetical protein RCF34_20670 [Pseudomonas sp. 102515]|uniref:hypothetical protein n=1 Tax=Pseudomonas sp. 102515 TaxID=3071568 RepID=UPI00280161E4|nr:hypothetical protein [Pseudomonas sp. 102515]MDQ7915528.1 hypothetical protein [Pseudomonas sp. 102515]